MAKSDNLCKAKITRNDEFHIRLEDIESEISHTRIMPYKAFSAVKGGKMCFVWNVI